MDEVLNLEAKTDRELLLLAVQKLNFVANAVADAQTKAKNHDRRLDSLESWRDKATGIAVLIVLVVGPAVAWALGRI